MMCEDELNDLSGIFTFVRILPQHSSHGRYNLHKELQQYKLGKLS